jgi:hypothetical protein
MSNHEPHCPFLNRADSRCANHFSLDKLDRAFNHCFGSYHSCATYSEMLHERQALRAGGEREDHGGLTVGVVYANLTVRQRPANVTVNQVRLQPQHATAA